MILRDKIILITGGANGIGFALGKLLLQKGAKVFSFDKVKLKKAAGATSIKNIIVDITNPSQIQRGLKKITRRIDILINNAGIMRRGKIFETKEEDFDLLFGVNFKGQWLTTKYARPRLSKRPMIVIMSSRHGLKLPDDPALYGLTKKLVLDFAKALEAAYPKWDVRTLCPGPTSTALCWYGIKKQERGHKKKFLRSPDYIAQKIIKLLESDKKKLIFDPRIWDELIADS